jgi:hypothetical protein
MRGFEEWFFHFVSGKKKKMQDFLKNKTLPSQNLLGRVTGKLFGNDGTHRFPKIKKRNWNHR